MHGIVPRIVWFQTLDVVKDLQMAIISLLFLSLLGYTILRTLYIGFISCHLSSIPGPWYSRFTHLVLKFYIITGRRIHYVDSLHQKYGSVVRIAPNEVAVSDLEGFANIHKIGGGFLKSPWYETLVAREPGIFAQRDPNLHAARRRLFAQAFSNSALQRNWATEIHEKTRRAVARIKADALISEADILKWWTLMATDVIAHLAFGESFDMLELGKVRTCAFTRSLLYDRAHRDKRRPFQTAQQVSNLLYHYANFPSQQTPYIDAVQSALLGGVLRNELPWLYRAGRWLPFKGLQTLVTADDVVYEYGALAVRNMKDQNHNSRNLFNQMMAANEGPEKTMITDSSIRLEAGNLIVAGSDTTAVTLTYLIWAVLKDPALQRDIEAEVGKLSPALELDELKNAALLNSAIEEALRLYGAAPGALPRVVPRGGTTVNGYCIPEGMVVSTQAYTMHRHASFFSDPYQ